MGTLVLLEKAAAAGPSCRRSLNSCSASSLVPSPAAGVCLAELGAISHRVSAREQLETMSSADAGPSNALKEVLPKAGLVYSEKGNLGEILCKPKLIPIKSRALIEL